MSFPTHPPTHPLAWFRIKCRTNTQIDHWRIPSSFSNVQMIISIDLEKSRNMREKTKRDLKLNSSAWNWEDPGLILDDGSNFLTRKKTFEAIKKIANDEMVKQKINCIWNCWLKSVWSWNFPTGKFYVV